MSQGSEPQYLTATQIAAELGLHVQTVQKYFREDGLPGRKIGKEWTTTRAAFDQWITSGPRPSALDQSDVPAGATLPPLETK
jgi:excisionase family DNA binding protein